MKKILFIFLTSTMMSLGLFAQRHQIGPFIGVSYYMGDIVQSKIFTTPGFNIGINYRYNINPRFAVKIAAHYGEVSGDSKNNKKSLQYQNLNFHSTIMDVETDLEINFLEYMPGSMKQRFTPYIFAGLGVFSYNPKTDYQGVEYALQPLGTEGQGLVYYSDKKSYKLASLAIPFGIGFKYNISKTVTLGLEWGMRKTFTDYLDDVSSQYADPVVLRVENSAVAAALSNRTFEQEAIASGLDISIGSNGTPNNPVDFDAYMQKQSSMVGKQRGSKGTDWYGIAGLTVMFKIGNGKKEVCPAYPAHKYFKEYQI